MQWPFRKRNISKSQKWEGLPEDIRSLGRAPLSEITRRVKQIEIKSKKQSKQQLLGQYKARFRGQGMQFSDFRTYGYGDDTRHIDWRASAKTDQILLKTYDEERELNLVFVVDISASLEFGTQGSTKRELMALALASIAFSALANNDRVGLLLFSNKVERYVPAKKGKKHVLRIIDELLKYKSIAAVTEVTSTLDFIRANLPANSIVILASDFFYSLDQKRLLALAQRHDLIGMQILDPRDYELPNIGLIEFQDFETGLTQIIDTSSPWWKENYSSKSQVDNLLQAMRQAGASVLSLPIQDQNLKALAKFFRNRGR